MRKSNNILNTYIGTIFSYYFFINLLIIGCDNKNMPEIFTSEILVHEWTINPVGTFAEPWFGGSLDVDFYGHEIFIADYIRKQVFVIDETGDFSRYIGSNGHGPGEYLQASQITISPGGSIYVSPGFTGVLNQYDISGNFIRQINHRHLSSQAMLTISTVMALSDSAFVYCASHQQALWNIDIARAAPLVAFIVNNEVLFNHSESV